MSIGKTILVAVVSLSLAMVMTPPASARPAYDIQIRDSATDEGSVPQSSGGTSPDLGPCLDGDCTRTTHQSPFMGGPATNGVLVTDRMSTALQAVTVNLQWAEGVLPTAWPGSWTSIATLVIAAVPGSGTAAAPWPFPMLPDLAVLARLDTPDDPLATGPTRSFRRTSRLTTALPASSCRRPPCPFPRSLLRARWWW